jgi:hypothetical protein
MNTPFFVTAALPAYLPWGAEPTPGSSGKFHPLRTRALCEKKHKAGDVIHISIYIYISIYLCVCVLCDNTKSVYSRTLSYMIVSLYPKNKQQNQTHKGMVNLGYQFRLKQMMTICQLVLLYRMTIYYHLIFVNLKEINGIGLSLKFGTTVAYRYMMYSI